MIYIFLFFIAVILLILFSGFYLAKKILKPTRYTLNDVYESEYLINRFELNGKKNPRDYQLQFDSIKFYSKRKKKILLKGWFIPNKKKENTCIIFIHGIWSNRLKPMLYLSFIKKTDYSCLLFDLSASGESTGKHSTMGFHEKYDILGAIDFLKKEYNIKNIILYAFSMGCASALRAASELNDIKKIILDSPYFSAKKVLIENAQKRNYPKILVKLAFFYFEKLGKLTMNKLEMAHYSKKVSCPILILHSKKDERTSYSHSISLAKSFEQNTQLCLFEKGEHVRLYTSNESKYETKILNFLNK